MSDILDPGQRAQQRAFFDSICETPDDDAPRLIYADWLEETGILACENRANHIRLSCEAAKRKLSPAEQGEMERLAEGSLSDWKKIDGIPPEMGVLNTENMHRGFFDLKLHDSSITGILSKKSRLREFIPHYPADRITFRHGDSSLPEFELMLTKLPPSPTVRSLNLAKTDLNNWGLDGLVDSLPQFPRLQELNLDNNPGLYDIGALAESPEAARITKLSIEGCDLNDNALEALAESEYLHPAVLEARDNHFSDEGIRTLCDAENASYLRELAIEIPVRGDYPEEIATEAVRAIAESPQLKNLEKLSIGRMPVNDEAAIALAESENLPSLRVLKIQTLDMTDAGAVALLTSPHLRLRELSLGTDREFLRGRIALAPENSAALRTLPRTRKPTLEKLELIYQRIGNEGCKVLAASPWLKNLRELNLASNAFNEDGLAALVGKKSKLRELRELSLANSGLDPEMITPLAQNTLPHLSCLNLRVNPDLENESAAMLATSTHLGGLQSIDMRSTSVTRAPDERFEVGR